MAGAGVELAQGYISLSVSTRGVGTEINNAFRSGARGAEREGRQAGQNFGRGFEKGSDSMLRSAVKLTAVGVAVRQISKGFPDLTFGLESGARKATLLAAGLTAATAAAAPLAAVAGGAILALGPALAGAAVGAGTLALAFKGVGDAIGAVKTAREAAAGEAAAQSAKEVANAAAAATATKSALRAVKDAREAVSDARVRGAASIRQALDNEARAELNLASAQKDTMEAQKGLTAAREAAKRSIQDMNLSLEEGRIAEQRQIAELATAKKQLELDMNDPRKSAAEKEQAQLDYKDREFALKKLQAENKRLAGDTAAANKAGVKGSKEVLAVQKDISDAKAKEKAAQAEVKDAAKGVTQARVEAAQSVSKAEEGVRDAQARVIEVQKQYAAQAKETSASQQALTKAMDDAGVEGAKFAIFLDSLRGKVKTLQAAAQSGFLPGLTDGIKAVLPLMPNVVNLLEDASAALGDMARQAGAFLGGPEGKKFIDFLAVTTPPLLKQFGAMVGNLFEGFIYMLPKVLPLTDLLMEGLVNLTDTFKQFTEGNGLTTFVKYIISMLPAVSSLLGNAVGLITDLVKAALPLAGPVLGVLDALLVAVRELFGSKDFANFVTNIGQAIQLVVPLFPVLTKALGTVFAALSGQLLKVLPVLVPAVGDFAVALSEILIGLSPLLPSLIKLVAALVSGLLPALYPVINLIRKALVPVVDLLAKGVEAVTPYIAKFVAALGKTTGPGGKMREVFQKVAGVVVELAKKVFPVMLSIFKVVVAFIRDEVVPRVVTILGAFKDLGAVVLPILKEVGGTLLKVFKDNLPLIKEIFGTIKEIVTGVLDYVATYIKAVTKVISFIWDKFGTQIKGVIAVVFKTILGVVKGALTIVKGIIKTATSLIKGDWKGAWEGIKTILSGAWTIIKSVIKGAFEQVHIIFGGAIKKIINKVGEITTYIGGKFKTAFNKVKEILLKPIRDAKTKLSELLGTGKIGMQTLFTKAVEGIGKALDKVKEAAKKPINFVIDTIYNKGIRKALNLIPGVDLKEAALIGSTSESTGKGGGKKSNGGGRSVAIANRTGGVLPGFTPGFDGKRYRSDSGDELHLSGGEGILTPYATRMVGGEKGIKKLNDIAAKQKFAGGGVFSGGAQVVPGEGNQHSRAQYPWARYAGDFPNAAGTPIHAWKDGVVAMVKYLTTSYGKHTRINHGGKEQTLYAHQSAINVQPGQQVKQGQVIGRVGNTGRSFGNHLHWEVKGGIGKIIKGIAGSVGSLIKKWVGSPTEKALGVVGGKLKSLAGPWAGVAGAAGKEALKQAASFAKNNASAPWNQADVDLPGAANPFVPSGKGTANVVGRTSPVTRNAARVIGPKFGISTIGTYPGHQPSETKALDFMNSDVAKGNAMAAYTKANARSLGVNYLIWNRRIWNIQRDREGWRPYFDGGSSDPSRAHTNHMHASFFHKGGVHKVDPMGINMLKQMGVKTGTYDTGGKLTPGYTLAYNGTGKNETIRTHDQERAAQAGPMIGAVTLVSRSDNPSEDMAAVAYKIRVLRRSGVAYRGSDD